jgi:hypothetical protein
MSTARRGSRTDDWTTDRGRLDGDTVYGPAAAPMQFSSHRHGPAAASTIMAIMSFEPFNVFDTERQRTSGVSPK